MYSRALSRRLPPPTPPPLYQVAAAAADGRVAAWAPANAASTGWSIQPCSSGSTSVGLARPTACDCGAVTVRAAGRGWAETVPALPARPGWIGSAVGSQAGDADADTWCAPGPSSRATTESSTLPLCRCPNTSRIFSDVSRTFRRNFSEVARKLLESFHAVSRKFPGGVEAVHAPSCDIPLPLAMFGGRRTACGSNARIPSGTSWLQARRVPQVGSPLK